MVHKIAHYTVLKTILVSYILILFIQFYSCDKIEREPKVETGAITDITINSARASGNIIDVGDGITDHGHCWSLSPGATVSNFKTMHGAISRTGSYPSILQSLQHGTKYYIKAYVENANGDFYYGGESSFTTTSIAPPTVITLLVASITSTTATSGGNVTSDGGAVVTARGVCWSTSPNPTTSNSKTSNGSGTGSYTSNLTGLTANTTYHVRAYATNSTGIAYGNDLTFTTPPNITLPTVTTGTTTLTSSTTATSGGNVTSDGGATVTARGVCWSTSSNPTVSLSTKTTNGTGTGSFTSSITGLAANTTYHVRAYATNSGGTSYGSDVTFTTPVAIVPPTVTTGTTTATSSTTATSGGNVTSDGGAAVTARGVCWSTSSNPTVALSTKTSNGTGTGSFTSSITGLSANTTYHVRAYATNSAGTAYGSDLDFTTYELPPVAAFTGFPRIITSGQSVQFTDQSANNPTSWSWNFGDGSTSSSQHPSHAYSLAGNYTITLTATNNYGSDIETKTDYITVEELSADNWIYPISPSWLGGELFVKTDICNNGQLSHTYVLTAEIYDANTHIAYVGQKATAMILPGFSEELTFNYIIPLDWEVKNYNFRIVVWSGTPFYSAILDDDIVVFTVEEIPSTVSDIDGNVYNTVTIGTQVWMTENLKTTRYNDGSNIPLVTDNTAWGSLTTPGYCWYNNDATTYRNVYGALYNWYAVNTGKLCPSGCHVPSDAEWTTLTDYLGGENVAGGKLKSTGTIEEGTGLWYSPNTGATNETGFTAVPGGFRSGSFDYIGVYGVWWSSTEYTSAESWDRDMGYSSSPVYRAANYKERGFSVRCVRD